MKRPTGRVSRAGALLALGLAGNRTWEREENATKKKLRTSHSKERQIKASQRQIAIWTLVPSQLALRTGQGPAVPARSIPVELEVPPLTASLRLAT